jgi:multiple sugar transport system ATP-binding protein
LFVAQFIGSPAMNIVNGTLRRNNGRTYVEASGGVRWPITRVSGNDGQAVMLGVRPEHLTIAEASDDAVAGEIIVVEPMGAETELLIKAGDEQVTLTTNGRPNVNPGERIGLALDPAATHLFDQKSGERLTHD